jgi:hypothetical protein
MVQQIFIVSEIPNDTSCTRLEPPPPPHPRSEVRVNSACVTFAAAVPLSTTALNYRKQLPPKQDRIEYL